MKKVIALLLAAILLLAASAFADELPYIWQLPQYNYVRTTLMTEESYPEVRLMPTYPFMLFTSNPAEPLFLCFPGPEGAAAADFDSYSAHYLDVDNLIAYTYIEDESNSFEEFLNKAPADDCILLDGSDGTAAYIEPEDGYAYGMIATKELGKSAKLRIIVRLDKLDSKMPLDTRVDSLSAAILAEVARVRSQMRYELYDPYWSYNQYAGIKFLDYDFQKLCCIDFPAAELTYEDGSVKSAPFLVTQVDGTQMKGAYAFGDGVYIEVEVNCDTYSYAMTNLEEQNPDACVVTLANGSEWTFYASNSHEDGTIYSWYASRAIEGLMDDDRQMYLTVHMSGNRLQWADINDCMTDVAKWDAGMWVVDPAEDPYVAPEKPAKAEPDQAPAEGGWTCPNCGAEGNTGNFCGECGTPRPEPSAEWTCPGCGQVNEGNFCPNCGTAKP